MELHSGGRLAKDTNAIIACETVPFLNILCNTSRAITEMLYQFLAEVCNNRERERDGFKKWEGMLVDYQALSKNEWSIACAIGLLDFSRLQ